MAKKNQQLLKNKQLNQSKSIEGMSKISAKSQAQKDKRHKSENFQGKSLESDSKQIQSKSNNVTKQIKKADKQQTIDQTKNNSKSGSNKKTKSSKKNDQTVQKPVKATKIQPEVKGKPWSELQYTLREQIVESLRKCGFKNMMPVQQASIPLLLKNYDLAVEAQTGSGKTLSFLIPLVQKFLAMNISSNQNKNQNDQAQDVLKQFKPTVKFLIISPTRELCQQTFNVLVRLLQNIPSKQRSEKYLSFCHCATGGSDMHADVAKLKESTIAFVGTIGRIRQLAEHMDQNWLKKVQYLYVDQADRVLKQKGIEQLIRSVQKIRRTAMFSATLQTLIQKNYEFYGMRNLAKISLKQAASTVDNLQSGSSQKPQDKRYIIPKSLTNTYLQLPSRLQKMQFLTNFLKNQIQESKVIVFFNTCASVDYYTKMFNSYFNLKEQDQIVGLHGKLKTNRRQKLIKKFLKRPNGCLFATDVVSRGIDFDHIHFIVQVDPPEDPDNYVHRIGRTARINRPGTAILLIEDDQGAFINYLAEKSVGVQQITDPTNYYSKNDKIDKIQQIAQKMDQIMRTDRDIVEKSKKAFVSYIRSYKEHDLRYIFEFKNLDIGKTAHSFFMYRIPRIKQILGKQITSFTQSLVDIEAIPWIDKNQQLQFSKKIQRRQQQQVQKKRIEQRIMKNADAKNDKSKRKRIKAKIENRNQQTINKQHRQLLKQKIASTKTMKNRNYDDSDDENKDGNDSFNGSQDTEQIENRMNDKNNEKSSKKEQKVFKSRSKLYPKKH